MEEAEVREKRKTVFCSWTQLIFKTNFFKSIFADSSKTPWPYTIIRPVSLVVAFIYR